MKGLAGILAAVILFSLFPVTAAAAAPSEPAEGKELTAGAVITCPGNASVLTDGRETTYTTLPSGGSVTIAAPGEIGSLYIIFDKIYGEWTLSDGTAEVVCGTYGFLHEYVDVAQAFGYAPTNLTLTFPEGECSLSEVHLFGPGQVPAWVQRWEPPCEKADLVLFSTHVDDEQLFFAGVLPYYAGERGYAVQVAYFIDPFADYGQGHELPHQRPHEQLNGLWTVGVRHYPAEGVYVDAYSESAEDAYADQARYGFTREDMLRSQTEIIRRFQPQVIVGHDIEGEYSHGQHIINCETLMEAVELAADPSYDPDSAAEYGVWDTPKTYLHLWQENELVMDWDVPLDAFDGKTAFQVSQEGFLCHKSQQWTRFRGWMLGEDTPITKATEIETASPCLYGLYRTTVGLDTVGGDMFENVLSHAQAAQAEVEAERQRQEQAAQAAAQEAAQAAAQETPNNAQTAPAEEPGTGLPLVVLLLPVGGILLFLSIWLIRRRKARKHKRYRSTRRPPRGR